MPGLFDSLIIGLLAFRILRGQLLRSFTESILVSLFSFSILAGWSTQSTKALETDKMVHYAGEPDHFHTEQDGY